MHGPPLPARASGASRRRQRIVCRTAGRASGSASGWSGSTGHGAGNTVTVSPGLLLGEACTLSISALPKPAEPNAAVAIQISYETR